MTDKLNRDLEKLNQQLKDMEKKDNKIKRFVPLAVVAICIIFVAASFIASLENPKILGFATIDGGDENFGVEEVYIAPNGTSVSVDYYEPQPDCIPGMTCLSFVSPGTCCLIYEGYEETCDDQNYAGQTDGLNYYVKRKIGSTAFTRDQTTFYLGLPTHACCASFEDCEILHNATAVGSVTVPGGYHALYPAIAVRDLNGTYHLVWQQLDVEKEENFPDTFENENWEIYYSESSNASNGTNWTPPVKISGMTVIENNTAFNKSDIFPDVSVGRDGTVWAVWQTNKYIRNNNTEEYDWHIYMSNCTSNCNVSSSWSFPKMYDEELVEYLAPSEGFDDINPSIDVDWNNMPHVVWQTNRYSNWDSPGTFDYTDFNTINNKSMRDYRWDIMYINEEITANATNNNSLLVENRSGNSDEFPEIVSARKENGEIDLHIVWHGEWVLKYGIFYENITDIYSYGLSNLNWSNTAPRIDPSFVGGEDDMFPYPDANLTYNGTISVVWQSDRQDSNKSSNTYPFYSDPGPGLPEYGRVNVWDSNWNIYKADSNDFGVNWNAYNITANDTSYMHPVVVFDEFNRTHVSYQKLLNETTLDWEIMYTNNDDYSAQQNVSNDANVDAYTTLDVGMIEYDNLDPRAHIAWHTNRTGSWSVYYENNVTINMAPTQGTPILNSTNGTNLTNENLTVYNVSTYDFNGDDVKNIINWYKNENPVMALHMPFEGGSTSTFTKDYSGHGNDGSVVNPIWNATGGYDGLGAYHFNKSGGIDLGNNLGPYLNGSDAITTSVWVKTHNDSGAHTIISFVINSNSLGYSITMNQYPYNITVLSTSVGGEGYKFTSTPYNQSKEWIHVVGIADYKNDKIEIYIDGLLEKSQPISFNNPQWTYGTPTGVDCIGSSGTTGNCGGNPFNGTIDDIRIYNYSLSPEQIFALYNNRTDLIVSNETEGTDIWQACITPNDGTVDGETKCSDNLTILASNLPTQGTPILNSTYGTNYTTEDLIVYNQSTADIDHDEVKNIINWYKNETPIEVLNMPFEGGSTSAFTKDYSDYGNNGKVINATWNSTAGYDGLGAYEFDGNAYINLTNTSDLDFNDTFSVSFWFNANTIGNSNNLVLKGNQAEGYLFILVPTNQLFFNLGNGTHWVSGGNLRFTSLSTGSWYHVVGVFNASYFGELYINGTRFDYEQFSQGLKGSSSGNPFVIGGAGYGSSTSYFDGTIDDVRVYNIALSSDQIVALHRNGTDLIVSEETEVGDVWEACITPNDGFIDGETKCSNNLTVLETPPVPPTISIALVDPDTDTNYSQNEFNTFTVNVSCGPESDCGEINVTLDPHEVTKTTEEVGVLRKIWNFIKSLFKK